MSNQQSLKTPNAAVTRAHNTALPLAGKVVFVTGGGGILGLPVVTALAKAGADVAIVDFRAEKGDAAAAKVRERGRRALSMPYDVTVREQVDAAVAKTISELGPPTVLVNMAVQGKIRPVMEITDETLALAFRSGVCASLYCMQACYPSMLEEGGGRIINVGTGAGAMGLEKMGAYAIAKEGARAMSKVAASEWGQHNITVNVINPMTDNEGYRSWATPELHEQFMSRTPMRRWPDAETEIGGLIVFLAGPGGGCITGRTIHYDGGFSYYDR